MSNIKEQIRQEIEKRKIDSLNRSYTFVPVAMQQLLEFIDSLPDEKPSKDLEEEVKRYYSDNFTYISSDQPTLSILTNIARHFAEWQKEQMMKDAVEVDVDDLNGEIYNNCIEKGMTGEDKVRIFIVKED